MVDIVRKITGHDKHMRIQIATDKVKGGTNPSNGSVGEVRGNVEIGKMGDNDRILRGGKRPRVGDWECPGRPPDSPELL
jgi:hypothetical protein